jgi:hypothetical protein
MELEILPPANMSASRRPVQLPEPVMSIPVIPRPKAPRVEVHNTGMPAPKTKCAYGMVRAIEAGARHVPLVYMG